MENWCNEWGCEHNEDGKCVTNDCPKMNNVFDIISKKQKNNKESIYENLGCL